MKRFKLASAVGTALLPLFAASAVYAAIATDVQISTAGTGVYDVLGVNEFDWQSSGDLLIRDNLDGTGSIANGVLVDSFALFAATAIVGDTVTFGIDIHTRLNDMLNQVGGSVAPATLDANGAEGGDTGFEITLAFSGIETAKVIAPGVLVFGTLTGTFNYYFDVTPDSDVGLGTGFVDGVTILSGTVVGNSGLASFNILTGAFSGNTLTQSTVTGYDSNYIETDPTSNSPLVGTTFDTLVSLTGALQAVCGDSNGPGAAGTNSCVIGLPEYTKLAPDLVLKADANSEFSANPIPEPGSLALLGVALLGAGFVARRKLG